MVPAMRVFRPSVGKRVIVLMPDSPAVSLAQLSALPAPSEVTTPRPVTTTSGRPILSLPVVIFRSPSANSFDQRETFASPVSDAGHHDLGQIPGRMAAPDPSCHTAETDYHVEARPWPARYSWGIAAPAHDRDMNRWRARQDRRATPETAAPLRSRGWRRSRLTEWRHGRFLSSL